MTPPKTCLLTISVLAALAASPASAITTVHTSSAAFLAQVTAGSYTETFQGSAGDAPSFSYLNAGFGYTVSAPLQSGSAIYRSGNFISTLFADSPLTITFTSGAPTAVGANFYGSDSSDAFVPSASLTIRLNDGTLTTFTPGGTDEYRGFTSTVPIASLMLSAPGSGRHVTVDNLTVGLSAPVPEPVTVLLMVLGVAAVGSVAGRRRATVSTTGVACG